MITVPATILLATFLLFILFAAGSLGALILSGSFEFKRLDHRLLSASFLLIVAMYAILLLTRIVSEGGA